jgi:uncharacterized membrane protein YdjX (TVP38/TMEM64 family)
MRAFIHLARKNLLALCRMGPAGLLAAFWLTVPGLAGLWLLVELGSISRWLTSLGPAGIFVYAGIFLVSSGLGLLPTTAQAILGGWVFGPLRGVLAGSAAFAGSALIGYVVARTIAHRRIMALIETRAEARAIREAILGRGFWQTAGMIALLRLPPQSPYAFTNLVMVGCGAPLLPFILGTVVGLLPRTLLLMVAASAAAQTGAADIQGFVTRGPGWPVAAAGVAAVVVVMAVMGMVARSALARLKVDPLAFR